MPDIDDRLAPLRAQIAGLDAGGADVTLETGLAYTSEQPVRIHVRRRGHRFDLDDDGRAVRLAGRPGGWLDRAEQVCAADGMNVNRRGVLFVPAVDGRDIAALAVTLAGTSRAAYLALLDLAD